MSDHGLTPESRAFLQSRARFEHTSGTDVRQGSIDLHDNQHVRLLLVEAAWRLLRYQPLWHARTKLVKRMTTRGRLEEELAPGHPVCTLMEASPAKPWLR